MVNHASLAITDADVAAYRRDGAVCLRGVVPDLWVERLAAAAEEVFAHPNAFSRGGRFFSGRFMWRDHPQFRAFVFESPMARIAQRLMGSRSVTFIYDHLFNKEPGTPDPSPWHNDLPYWPVDGEQICSIWVPFDYVTPDSGVVQYVRGSHRWGKKFKPVSAGGDSREFSGSGFEPVPDIEASPGQFELITWELRPGDCLVHHALTVHGARGNATSDRRRRALATRWGGDDAVYDPRPGTMSLPEDPRIQPGVPLASKLFPLVIPATSGEAQNG